MIYKGYRYHIVKDCTFCKNLLKYTKKKKLHYQTEEMII